MKTDLGKHDFLERIKIAGLWDCIWVVDPSHATRHVSLLEQTSLDIAVHC